MGTLSTSGRPASIKKTQAHTYPRPQMQDETGIVGQKNMLAVRSATASGSFGAVWVITRDGARLWSRTQFRRGRHDDQLREVRKGLLGADALGAVVRHAERAASEFGVHVENRRAA